MKLLIGVLKWIFLVVLAVVFFYSVSRAQEVPNAPSAVQTCQNGKPPATGKLAKIVGSCPFDKKPVEKWNGVHDSFIHIGNGNRRLHPDKKSWIIFTTLHAGLWASTVVAVRRQKTSGELPGSEYPAVAVVTGIDALFFLTINPTVPAVGAPVYGMIHYSKSASK